MNLSDTAVIVTAFRRPWYLRQALESWQRARGTGGVHSVTLALGWDEGTFKAQLGNLSDFREATGLGGRARVKFDSSAARRSNGMHRAIAEAAQYVLEDPEVQFLVFGEEDIIVSSDVLEYMAWAREEFAADERVLIACAHSPGGQGWDPRVMAGDAHADQEAVRLHATFNSWVWGTTRGHWERILEPGWDYDCAKGPRPDQMGYDWGIYHMVQREGYLCALPDASRSQNIGCDGGWAANPADFCLTQAQSFKSEREPVSYRLTEAEAEAA